MKKDYNKGYYKDLIDKTQKSNRIFRVEWEAQKEWLRELNDRKDSEKDLENEEIRKEKALNSFEYFVEVYMRHNCLNSDGGFINLAPFHKEMAYEFNKDRWHYTALYEVARGHAKTSNLAHILLWQLIKGKLTNVVYVSKSNNAVKEMLMNIRNELENNKLLVNDFGPFRKDKQWEELKFIIPKYDTCFNGLSPGVSPRGIKYKNYRITELLLDDVDTNERCLNPNRMEKLFRWFDDELVPATSAQGFKIVLIGNRFSNNTLLEYFAKKPLDHYIKINAIDENGNPSWRENYTLQKLEYIKTFQGSISFEREYMNNPIEPGSIFKKEHLQYGLIDYNKLTNGVIAIDPSWTSTGDYKAVISLFTDGNNYYIEDIFLRKTDMSILVDWVFEKVYNLKMKGKTPTIYFESVMNQNILADEFYEKEKEYGVKLPMILDKSVKQEKYSRIESMHPYFERRIFYINNEIINSNDYKQFEAQMLGFNKGSKLNDDGPDCLEFAWRKLSPMTKTSTYNNLVDNKYSKYSNY